MANVENYRSWVGDALIDAIREQGRELKGLRICNVNATAAGGGFAELLSRIIPVHLARMDAGEDFTVIDVRNPTAWAETDTLIPEAIRVPLDKIVENHPRVPKNRPVLAFCT
jgi:hypothetical protein